MASEINPEVKSWDDDAIIQAFNFAVKSYHKSGEIPPMDVVNELPKAPKIDNTSELLAETTNSECALLDSTAPEVPDPSPSTTSFAQQDHTQQTPEYYQPDYTQYQMPHPPPGPLPPIPSGLDDEALNDLLLAWYYSGYYTGRYQALMEQRRNQPP